MNRTYKNENHATRLIKLGISNRPIYAESGYWLQLTQVQMT